jgi:hypothetical protein
MRHAATPGARGLRALAIALTLVALGSALPAAAQEGAEEEEEDGGRLSGAIALDLTNAYFFRGILNEREGVIFQPIGELYYSLISYDDGLIRDVSIGGGVWASIHSEETLAEHGPHSVYEVDWYPLISMELAGGVSVTTYYYYYTSPNGAFDRADELDVEIAWDDSEVLGRWALQPWANLAVETQNTAFGDEEGMGLQLGVEPTLYTFEDEDYPVSFTLPLELGLGIEDYYEDESGGENFFGYFQYGLAMSVPLAFMPEGFGDWDFHAKASFISLSNTLTEANRGRSFYPIGVVGVGVEF